MGHQRQNLNQIYEEVKNRINELFNDFKVNKEQKMRTKIEQAETTISELRAAKANELEIS